MGNGPQLVPDNFQKPYYSKLDSGDFEASDSSIHYLSTQVNVSFEELLRGQQSFGGFLEDNGFVAVPYPNNPGRNGNNYFRCVILRSLCIHCEEYSMKV